MQKIYHQGVFDGACFLYSIVNGYSALQKKEVEQPMWEEALKWIPFREDYISEIGTQRTDNDYELYTFTIKRLLREFKNSKDVTIQIHKEISHKEQIQKLLSEKSVLIFNRKGHHWLTAVDYNEKYLETVCSAELVEKATKSKKYQELNSSNLNRLYNNKQQYGKLKWLYQSTLIELSNSKA